MSKVKQSYIRRGIAIFFLLFTAVDLATPHLCAEEMGLLLASVETSLSPPVEPDTTTALSIGVASYPQEESPTPREVNEDCFCCCSHIIPSLHFAVASLVIKPVISEPIISSLPTPPPHKLFHPPRLS